MTSRILDHFSMHGSVMATDGNNPLPLIDPGAVWLVTRGHVNIVAMTITAKNGRTDVQRTHLLRIGAGEFMFGFHPPSANQEVLLLGYGSADAEVSRLVVANLARISSDAETAKEIAPMVDRWVTAICALCAGDMAPSGTQNLRPGNDCTLEQNQSAQPQTGVLWIAPTRGAVRFLSHPESRTIEGNILFPVGKDGWLTADRESVLTPCDSSSLTLDEAYWRGLGEFHLTVETVIDLQRRHERDLAHRRLSLKREADQTTLDAALTNLESILRRRRSNTTPSEAGRVFAATCRLVGERLGIEVIEPDRQNENEENANPLEEIARSSRFAFRRVRLEDKWHVQDGGPLLGFLKGEDHPIALLPASPTSYHIHDLVAGTVLPLTAARAREIEPFAFTFYRTLPERPLRGWDLLRFLGCGIRRDLFTVLLIGTVGGMLTLATPLAVGHVFDAILPSAGRTQLWHLTLGLAVAAFATAAFHVTRNTALIRIRHRTGMSLQAAIWERVVSLPARFFTKYSAGDLGMRVMGIETIMVTLSSSVMTSIVSSIFSLFSLGLLFYYSPPVALAALGLVLIVVTAMLISGFIQVGYQWNIETIRGKTMGMLLQFMNGMAKIRVAAAEHRAFAQWADCYARQARLIVKSRLAANALTVFNVSFPILSSMVIFWLVAGSDHSTARMSTGVFLAFLSAFASLLQSMIQLGSITVAVAGIVPVYRRLKPILEATPEVDDSRTDPGPLRGHIEVTNISFKYDADGPKILDDVSFHADPGEFVAMVGPSGSGKSTLLRILLGFEKPDAGAVAYDGFDASGLDPRRLRRQLGVVLQNGTLLPGDIFSNIIGSAVDLTLDDAWRAARLAGLEQDIEQMPMGMHTIIAEGAGTISGGQKQRLMIARALVTRPRIVFFDEATSALDNPTQQIVTESLDRLRATRIVIAHRLSTIQSADRIYVLDEGHIVQTGSYAELVKIPGMFLDLVKRQMA